jgi:subfamily B ATP-binding cassette protein MsbA
MRKIGFPFYKYLKSLTKLLKPFRKHIVGLGLLQVLTALLDLIGVTLLYSVIALIFKGHNSNNFQGVFPKILISKADNLDRLQNILVGLTLIVLTARIGIGIFQGYFTSWLGRTVHLFLTSEINKRLLRSPYRDITARTSGELSMALGDESYMVGQTIISLSEIVSTLVILLAYFIALFFISGKFAVILLMFLFVIGSTTLLTMKWWKKFGDLLTGQGKKLYSVMFDLINNMKAIRLFNYEEQEIKRYETLFMNYRNYHVKRDFYSELTTYVPLSVLYAIGGFTYIWYSYFIFPKPLIDGAIALLFFGYSLRILFASKVLASRVGSVFSNAGAGEDVFNILRIPFENNVVEANHSRVKYNGSIQFVDLTFKHLGQIKPLFDFVSISIPFKKHIAIVGETGSGKSTVLDLMMGLLKPDSGKILISGQDLNELNIKTWRSKVICISQEISLFNDSIFNNLTYGVPDQSLEKVHYYSKLALCHDFITDLPEGYGTVLNYQAKNISGGQKQRLLIAHALICEPEVLILDESTSSLDAYTQGIIMQNIKELYRDKTLIVVTHKIEMFPFFEHIIRLDKGAIAYEGNVKGYCDLYLPKGSS